MKVVFEDGETEREPLAIGVMSPTPPEMEPEVAFVAVQERVEELPEVMEEGEAERVQVGAGATDTASNRASTVLATDIVTTHTPVPEHPAPLQPPKVELLNGDAVRVTTVPEM